MDAQEVWEAALAKIQADVAPAVFTTWFQGTLGISLQEGVLTIRAPTQFVQTQLEGRFREKICSIASEVAGRPISVQFEGVQTITAKPELNCSFCSKYQRQIEQLISGPGGMYICNECIDVCSTVLIEQHGGFDAMRLELEKRNQKEKTMSEDVTQSEQSSKATNPFIAKYQKRTFEATQLGLEFPQHLHWRRDAMQEVASYRITIEGIIDEAGKIKVYEEVKEQFKEYVNYLRSQGVPGEPGVSKPDSAEAESSESRSSETTVIIEYPQIKELTAVLRDMLNFTERLFEHNEQLLEETKKLDDRLKKLEKYTEE